MMQRVGYFAVVLSLLLPLPGCQNGPAVGTVNGEVTFEGQPLKKGAIRFVPVDGNAPTAGAIIQDGHFTAEVPVGLMRVEIRASRVIGQRRAYAAADSPLENELEEIIPEKFNRESKLTLPVKKGTQEVRYDLKGK